MEDKPFCYFDRKDRFAIAKMIMNRQSRRIYKKGKIPRFALDIIKEMAEKAPSSCDRKAVKMIVSKKGIETLVGGKNWIEKADKVILFYAAELAYKSPAEKDFMPYLDTGFMAQNIYLICEVLNIGCCFVNPNHIGTKIEREGYRFCGAMALGIV